MGGAKLHVHVLNYCHYYFVDGSLSEYFYDLKRVHDFHKLIQCHRFLEVFQLLDVVTEITNYWLCFLQEHGDSVFQ